MVGCFVFGTVGKKNYFYPPGGHYCSKFGEMVAKMRIYIFLVIFLCLRIYILYLYMCMTPSK